MAINQLKAGAVLSYLSIGLNTFIGLLYTPFMLRMMGQSEFGLYSLAASVISYLTVLDLGFGNAIIRYTAKFRAEGKIEEQYNMFGMFIIIYSVISLITLLIGFILYNNIELIFDQSMNEEELWKTRIMVIIMVFNLAFTFPFSLFGAIITAYEKFVFQKLVNIIRIILNPIVMIVMLYMGYRSIGMVIVVTAFNVISLLINCWYCFNKLKIQIRFGKFNWGFFKEVSIYSFWILLNVIMDRIYWSTGQFILGIYKGTAAVAVYSVAIQLEHMYMSFSTAISSVFLPKITSIVVKEEHSEDLSNLFIKIGRIQYIIMAFILTGFIVFGYTFISIWAGVEYVESYYITLLFFFGLIIPLIQTIGIIILQARNQMKFRSICYIILAAFSLLLSIPLVKSFGGVGSAIAICIALLMGQGVIMNIYYWKKIGINIPLFWSEIIKMSITPLIMGFCGYILMSHVVINNFLYLFAYIVFFSLIYISLCWILDMNKFEKNLFRAAINNVINRIFSTR